MSINTILLTLAASAIFGGSGVYLSTPKTNYAENTQIADTIKQEDAKKTALSSTKKDFVNIVAVGDIMIGSLYPNVGYLPDDDAKNSFAQVKKHLVGDVVFGNLEGVLLDQGQSTKCRPNSTSCYAFQMPERYGKIIKEAGFNLLSTANNHAGDFGDTGRFNTGRVLDGLGVHHAGQKEMPCTSFTKNNLKYGMCAFSPNRNMVSINETGIARKLVQDMASKVDIMIVSFHGGAEGAKHTHVPKRPEIFLNENRGDVHDFSHQMIDVGADIVLGHGPHVTRAVELYKDRFIAYSLGNFNTYGAFNLRDVNGISPIINVKMDKQGKFISAKVTSTKQTKQEGLLLDPTGAAYQELKKLTETDFPSTPLVFSNHEILRKN